jgi:hypothetical protein
MSNAVNPLAEALHRLAFEAEREGANAEQIESCLRTIGAGPAVVEQIMANLLDRIVWPLSHRGVCARMIGDRLSARGFALNQVTASLARFAGPRAPVASMTVAAAT